MYVIVILLCIALKFKLLSHVLLLDIKIKQDLKTPSISYWSYTLCILHDRYIMVVKLNT